MSTKTKVEDHSAIALTNRRAHNKPNPLVDRAAFVRDVIDIYRDCA